MKIDIDDILLDLVNDDIGIDEAKEKLLILDLVSKSFSNEESIIIDLFEIIDQSEKRQIKLRDKITDLYDIIQNKK